MGGVQFFPGQLYLLRSCGSASNFAFVQRGEILPQKRRSFSLESHNNHQTTEKHKEQYQPGRINFFSSGTP
ncbi:MAG: hypothetical protein B6241_12895 [Spirochaetaceae bacterium 4572_59]|nr:MAG: hypothetical protein B6241_12895 [Spirochaetaceae bacterium 4572_59]